MAIQINLMQFLCVEWEVFSMTPSSATRWSSAKPVKPIERWADKVAKQMSLQQKFKLDEEKKPQSMAKVKAKLQVQNPSMQAEALPKKTNKSEQVVERADGNVFKSTVRVAKPGEICKFWEELHRWERVDRTKVRRRCTIS